MPDFLRRPYTPYWSSRTEAAGAIVPSHVDRLKAEILARRRRIRHQQIAAGVVVVLLLLASLPLLAREFQPDREARAQQQLITEALANARLGMTIREFNELFDGMHPPPKAAIALWDAESADSIVLTATGARGAVKYLAYDTSRGFLDAPYIAVAIFPKTRHGPPPRFIVFEAESRGMVATAEVECSRAMSMLREAPIVPEEGYQEPPVQPRRSELVSDELHDFWLTGRALLAHGAARELRCLPGL